jgi:hypothetical protein
MHYCIERHAMIRKAPMLNPRLYTSPMRVPAERRGINRITPEVPQENFQLSNISTALHEE